MSIIMGPSLVKSHHSSFLLECCHHFQVKRILIWSRRWFEVFDIPSHSSSAATNIFPSGQDLDRQKTGSSSPWLGDLGVLLKRSTRARFCGRQYRCHISITSNFVTLEIFKINRYFFKKYCQGRGASLGLFGYLYFSHLSSALDYSAT